MDRRGFVSFLALSLSGCLGTGDTNNSNETDGSDDTQVSDDWSQRDLNRTGETPYESTDDKENICVGDARDLAVETGDKVHEIRVEVRDERNTFYSVEGPVPADATVWEQNIVRKRGEYEVCVYVDGDLVETFEWRVDDGNATAVVRLVDGEVTMEVDEVSAALSLREVNGQDDAPTLDDVPPLSETDLLEHDAVAEAFEKAEDCADDPKQEGCNYFVEGEDVGVQVTGVEGEEVDSLYQEFESLTGECTLGVYVGKDSRVYEISIMVSP